MKTDLSHIPASAGLSPNAKLLAFDPGSGTTLIEDFDHEVTFLGGTFSVTDADGSNPPVLAGFAREHGLIVVDLEDENAVQLSAKQYAGIVALVESVSMLALKEAARRARVANE